MRLLSQRIQIAIHRPASTQDGRVRQRTCQIPYVIPVFPSRKEGVRDCQTPFLGICGLVFGSLAGARGRSRWRGRDFGRDLLKPRVELV